MNFAITLPKNNSSKKVLNMIVEFITKHHPFLSIIGIDPDGRKGVDMDRSIANAVPGAVIVIDSENRYDVDWFKSESHALQYGVKSDIVVQDDFTQAQAQAFVRFLDKFSAEMVEKMSREDKMVYTRIVNIGKTAPYAGSDVDVDAFIRHFQVKPSFQNEFYTRYGNSVAPTHAQTYRREPQVTVTEVTL